MARFGSAAYLIAALVVVFLVGSLIFTLLDPFWGGILDSQLFVSTTGPGSDAASWTTAFYQWVWLPGLAAILYTALVKSRRPSR